MGWGFFVGVFGFFGGRVLFRGGLVGWLVFCVLFDASVQVKFPLPFTTPNFGT